MGPAHASVDVFSARMQNILRIANRLKEVTTFSCSSVPPPSTSSHSSVINLISLPTPSPLLPLLLEVGADRELAIAASKIYEHRAEELRKYIQASIVAAAREIAELPQVPFTSTPDPLIRKIISTATEVYLQRLGQWKEEIIQRIEAPKPTVNAVAFKNSRTFNYDYVPILEHFFEENPFPTHIDKTFLAKQSKMEYRQIHVWFQNRRNRMKKEGKQLKKKAVQEAPRRPPYERMKGHIAADAQVPATSEARSEQASQSEFFIRKDTGKDTLSSSSPPHAFPSLYPPICHYDPFPCKSGLAHFCKPEWRRLPCGEVPPLLSTTTSINELVDKFSQLNVRDEARFKECPKSLSHSCAATSAITVIPSSAPHPSLLRCESRQEANIVQCYPIVRAAIPSLKAFQSCSPTLKSVTLVPTPISPDRTKLPGKRKTVPLPRRFPGRMGNTCRDTTPSENSSTSSPSPRLSSSDIESRNCSFSTVSSSRSPLGTTSPQELPHLFGSPCYSLFDDLTYLRDITALTVPPVS